MPVECGDDSTPHCEKRDENQRTRHLLLLLLLLLPCVLTASIKALLLLLFSWCRCDDDWIPAPAANGDTQQRSKSTEEKEEAKA